MMKAALMPALLLALSSSAWPMHGIVSVTGLSCEKKEVLVCSSPALQSHVVLHLTPWAFRFISRYSLPVSDLGARGPVRIETTQKASDSILLTATVSHPVELLIGQSQAPSTILYLDVPKLPPRPHWVRDVKPPKTNIAPPHLFSQAKPSSFWHALLSANHREGKPRFTLPRNFSHLSGSEQLFVLTNLERVVHGLWPLYGISPKLNRFALKGVYRGADPQLQASSSLAWGSNWYSGVGAIQATFSWMYDDGYGSQNIDCSRPGATGCWGHRANILGSWGPYGLFGGAVVRSKTKKSGTAEVFQMNLSPKTAAVTYTWAQAIKAGARPTGLGRPG